MWFTLALLSALFASVRKASEKQLSHKLHHFTAGWTIQLAALPLLLAALIWSGEFYNPLRLGPDFWLPTLGVCLGFYPLSVYLYFNSLKHGDLSQTAPLLSLGPIIALAIAWPLLGQAPTLIGFIGIVIVVTGVYVLNITDRYLHNPLKALFCNRANLFTLLNILLVGLVGILDKLAIDASGPVYFSFVGTVGAVVVLYATSYIFKVKEMHLVRRHAKPLLSAGSMFGGSYVLFSIAISQAPLAYVASVRNLSILISAAIGFAIFKESITRPKLAALVLIMLGVTVLGIA